jgi:hypothetical protein
MKKIILAVLMVLIIITPCLAENVKPDGMYSIEGTLWAIAGEDDQYFAFYEGNVHIAIGSNLCIEIMSSSYQDFIIFSLFNYETEVSVTNASDKIKCMGILFPLLGIGFAMENGNGKYSYYEEQYFFNKAGDNWQADSWCLPMY